MLQICVFMKLWKLKYFLYILRSFKVTVHDWTQSNLVGQIYCALSMGESLTICNNNVTISNKWPAHFKYLLDPSNTHALICTHIHYSQGSTWCSLMAILSQKMACYRWPTLWALFLIELFYIQIFIILHHVRLKIINSHMFWPILAYGWPKSNLVGYIFIIYFTLIF